jgi:hypothetical protein
VAPVDREFDNEAVPLEEEDRDEDETNATGRPDGILSAVAKVTFTLF